MDIWRLLFEREEDFAQAEVLFVLEGPPYIDKSASVHEMVCTLSHLATD